MTNPLETIACARKRLGRLAAIRTLLHATLPLGVTLAFALGMNYFNELALDHFGYIMDAVPVRLFRFSLLTLALIELFTVALLGWRSWSHASDVIRAAEEIDRAVRGQQEIVTLASLSAPANPEGPNLRSLLFPILWERVISSLESFDPRSTFSLQFRQPLLRSLALGAAAIIVFSSAAFALMTRPTPAQLLIHRLQLFANTVATSTPAPGQRQWASAARDVAMDLANPTLPPRQKIAELTALERELQKFEAKRSTADRGQSDSSGNGSGGGTGNGADSGRGSGPGKGSGSSQTGSGVGRNGSANQQLVELHNDIAKAQMKLGQEADSRNETATAQNTSSRGTGGSPKPGSNPHQPGGQNSPSGSGQIRQPETIASAKMSTGQNPGAGRNDRGSIGDTHLGEFPKPGNYQRFYQSGEHGPAIDVRDARYVTFRLPSEIESAGAGAIVPDNSRPRASTPYTNSPLQPQRFPASPDELQLVPPRYRELIR